MRALSLALIALIAVLHLYIAWFEIFAWESRGPEVFKSFPKELFAPTKTLAANQGLYNSFLAIGLIWALTIRDRVWQRKVALAFLLFVAMAGLFGAATASPRIFFIQALPAIAAIALVLAMGRQISNK